MRLKSFYFRLWKWLIYSGIFLVGSYCAYKVAPSGGPPDKSPPQVIATFPQADSVGVSSLPEIRIDFNEPLLKSSVQNQIWIIPPIPKGFDVKWKGSRQLRIIPRAALQKNQTYLVQLGTGISDLHQNHLKKPFFLAFSTGKFLNKGIVSGRVYARSIQHFLAIAFLVKKNVPLDSLVRQPAFYFAQVSKDGYFIISHLPWGKFLVVVLQDRDGNRQYTPMQDRIALPHRLVTLDSLHPRAGPFPFYPILEDTLPPRLQEAVPLNNHTVALKFSEDIRWEEKTQCQIVDSLHEKKYAVLGFSQPEKDSRTLLLFFPDLPEGKFQGVLRGVTDLFGNTFQDDSLVFHFNSMAMPDTVNPRIQKTKPAPKARQVRYNAALQLECNSPVKLSSLPKAVQMLDSTGREVNGHWCVHDWQRPEFQPDSLLQKNASYTVRIDLTKLQNLWGKSFGDSIYSFNFSTMDWAQLGEISGTISVPDSLKHVPVIVEAFPLGKEERYSWVRNQRRTFYLPFLPDGFYRLRAFLDRNGNEELDKGRTRPFQLAEPSLWYADTVKVRKRWTTQGIRFHLETLFSSTTAKSEE